jgi:hypothetical protein
MRLIFLYFLEIYAGMTVITVVIAGEYLMEITSECGARTLYMTKARFLAFPPVNYTHHLASSVLQSFWLFLDLVCN